MLALSYAWLSTITPNHTHTDCFVPPSPPPKAVASLANNLPSYYYCPKMSA